MWPWVHLNAFAGLGIHRIAWHSGIQQTNANDEKPECHSRCTATLQPQFGTINVLAVPKMENKKALKGQHFHPMQMGCYTHLDQKEIRNFLYGRNENVDVTFGRLCSTKW